MSEESNTNHDNAIGWLLLAIVAIAILWLIWHINAEPISNAIRWIRYGEMWLISLVTNSDYTIPYQGGALRWEDGFERTPQYASRQTPELLPLFSALAMVPLRIPFTIAMALFALWAFLYGPGTQYKKVLGLQGLIERQSKVFPVIAPFTKFNPSTQPTRPPGSPVPAELPMFAEALGPEEWLAYNAIPFPDGIMDRAKAEKALIKQLGGRWQGSLRLKNHEKILLAAFCLKASRKRDAADKLLGRIALCWSHDKGLNLRKDRHLLKDAVKIIKSRDLAQGTLEEANRHAFKTTALLRALQYAREEGGVLAPAQFVWLRAHDRTLWYPLNNLGRQSFHAEAMGAMAHFKAERMTKRPIPSPKVSDTLDAFDEYMASNKARPIPQLDYSDSKKRGVRKAV